MLRQGKDLVSGVFDGSGLVDAHMSSVRRDDALIGSEHPVNNGHVRLCAAHQETDIRMRTFTGFPNLFLCPFAPGISSVSGKLFQVCLCQAAQDQLMGAFHIVVFK